MHFLKCNEIQFTETFLLTAVNEVHSCARPSIDEDEDILIMCIQELKGHLLIHTTFGRLQNKVMFAKCVDSCQ